MKSTQMKISCWKLENGVEVPMPPTTTLDGFEWSGRIRITVSGDDGSLGLPFLFSPDDTAILTVTTSELDGMGTGDKKIKQLITCVPLSLGSEVTCSRTRSYNGKEHAWSAWEISSSSNGADVTWGASSSADSLVTAGTYNIKGERLNAKDGLPIANSNPGHTIHARLLVLDSSIAGTGDEQDKCITQVLTLSNRTGGDGDVYIRTGHAHSTNMLIGGAGWEPWSKLQQNTEVGQVTSLDTFTGNGVYSGVYTNGTSFFETFVMVVINNYAVSGATGQVRSISQFKYALNVDGTFSYKTRTGRGSTGISWGSWVDLGAATTTDIQDGAITAQKLSSDVCVKVDNIPVLEDSLSTLFKEQEYDFYLLGSNLGFYNVQGKKVGDAFNDALKSSTTHYAASLDVKKGDKVRLSTYVTSTLQGAVRPWVMVDADSIIVAISVSSYTYDYTDGVGIVVPQDATLYVACDVGYEDAFSLKISGGIVDELRDKVERVVDTSEALKTTNSPSLYLPNKTVLLSGASISDKVGYFEYAMKKLGLTGTNVSAAGKNISYLCYLLYSNTYRNHDVLIISHTHNFDVYSLPASVENYSAAEYEADEVLAPYVTTRDYREGTIVPPDGYTVDEMYAICYDYAIKKWMERCYNLRTTEGYDSLAGKNCQIVLMTYWHDARTVYNSAIRKLAKKWGLPLIKEDENIGFSKNRVHPVTGEQWSVMYCNGVPYSGKTEVMNGVTYGFHPSGIATEDWDTFANADAETMLQMLPDIQRRRAAIMIDFFKNAIY